MARKTQISKEVILDAAFQLLVREGYATINITNLAKEIGCSTQPIAWHFGNMDALRAELLVYCLGYMKNRFVIEGENASTIMEQIAIRYLELALDYPNLYKYLYMSEHEGKKMAAIAQGLRAVNQDKVIHMLKEEHGITDEDAEKYLLNMQMYVHGISSFAVTEIFFSERKVLIQMIHDASEAFLKQLKES